MSLINVIPRDGVVRTFIIIGILWGVFVLLKLGGRLREKLEEKLEEALG